MSNSNVLLVTDTHFTDKAEDSYRFGLFPYLVDLCHRLQIRKVFFLGDLTDYKDNHSGRLINKIVDSVVELRSVHSSMCLTFLQGNHDYNKDPSCATFKMLRHINGVNWISVPSHMHCSSEGASIALLPHSRQPLVEWDTYIQEQDRYDYVFTHATFSGSTASNGSKLDGLPSSTFRVPVFSGDIHVPQKIGRVVYVGSPYSIRFNDTFTPRVLALNLSKGTMTSYEPSLLRRRTLKVRSASEVLQSDDIQDGDQVKVQLFADSKLSNEAVISERREVLAACERRNVSVHGVSVLMEAKPLKVKKASLYPGAAAATPDERDFNRYVAKQDIAEDLIDFGRAYLMDT